MTHPGQRGGDTAVRSREIHAEQRIPGSRGPHPAWLTGGLEAGATTAQSTAVALRLRGDLDGPALEGALRALAERFAAHGARLYEAGDMVGAGLAGVLDDAAHEPFDLARGPLLRVGLYRRDARDVVILVVAHRVVTDACPMTALIRDLEASYRQRAGERPEALAARPGVTCGDSVRLYRWVSGSRRPAARQAGC